MLYEVAGLGPWSLQSHQGIAAASALCENTQSLIPRLVPNKGGLRAQVMVEFQRPSVECVIVNVTYMNQKATALTDFNSIPVVPEYVEVEATGFASNFLPGA